MAACLIGLGANLGDRAAVLRGAWERVLETPGVFGGRPSGLHATAAIGGPEGQPEFLNAAGVLETSLPPETLLAELQRIEQELGRERHERWGARSIDLDLLLYDQVEMRTPDLVLPHPRMAFRRFMLEPAVEVAADMVYPVNGWTIARLLEHLDRAADFVAIAAGPSVDRERVLADIAERRGVRIERLSDGERGWAKAIQDGPASQWVVSDFWPAEVARGRVESSGAAESLACASGLWGPKLVVVVDDGQASVSQRREVWKELTHSSETGPVLWLTTDSPALVADEVVAALDAMR